MGLDKIIIIEILMEVKKVQVFQVFWNYQIFKHKFLLKNNRQKTIFYFHLIFNFKTLLKNYFNQKFPRDQIQDQTINLNLKEVKIKTKC